MSANLTTQFQDLTVKTEPSKHIIQMFSKQAAEDPKLLTGDLQRENETKKSLLRVPPARPQKQNPALGMKKSKAYLAMKEKREIKMRALFKKTQERLAKA